MQYKECRTCGELLEISRDNFYVTQNEKGKYRFANPDCKRCYSAKEREERREKKQGDWAGSDFVPSKPNSYADDIQKEQVFNFLKVLGWKFNEEKGIWYDDIKKTKDGEYIGVWAPTPKKRKVEVPKVTEDTFQPLVFSKKAYKRDKTKDETIQLILKDFYVNNMSQPDIAEKYGETISFVKYYAKLYRQQLNGVYPKRDVTEKKRRKEHKSSRESIDDVPMIKLSHERLIQKYSPEFIRSVQEDYFVKTMKYKHVLEKYKEDLKMAKYIIHKTFLLLKEKRKWKK